jgi:hypothetical protein
MSSNKAHLVVSWVPLLSGALDECLDASDESCQGGIAAVAAYLRYYSKGEPAMTLPFLDKESPFVQMHPLGWSVNRLVYQHIMGYSVFAAPPSLLLQNKVDMNISNQDLSVLQSKEMPLLLTNAMVPPSNSWYPFAVPVFFDETTGIALLSVVLEADPMNIPQKESVAGVLNYVARLNAESGCSGNSDYKNLYDVYANSTKQDAEKCWVPVVVYADITDNFILFLDSIVVHENPPALVVYIDGVVPTYEKPRLRNGVWVSSHDLGADSYLHHALTFSSERKLQNVTIIRKSLSALDATLKDNQYAADIAALRRQADEAFANDPVVGKSTEMPFTRLDDIRRCQAGECEIGNLFTDAALWWADADISFSSSGGLRGPGWPAGKVKVSDIWQALPFSNSICTGNMSGVSMFKLFNYSINAATFEGENTNNGDRLLQVAGMRVTYNTEMVGSRLVAMDVLDMAKQVYHPVQRLKLYKFVTDSWLCGGFSPYPTLLVDSLVLPGENPGVTLDGIVYQNVVSDYLKQLSEPYVVAIEGRLVNDTSATHSLNLIQNPDNCPIDTYWRDDVLTCVSCPNIASATFLREKIDFESEKGFGSTASGSIVLVNSQIYSVGVVPISQPSWLVFSRVELKSSGSNVTLERGVATALQSGDRMTLFVDVSSANLEVGTAQSTVSFDIIDDNYPGCTGQEATFEAVVRVIPQKDLNQLGSIRFVGIALSLVAVSASAFIICWVVWNRSQRIVMTLQPAFLVAISAGVFILASSMIPLSVDDEIASSRGCDIACVASPWLMSMGFTVAMSALFSKLWRINKLFRSSIRRMQVREKDVVGPFAVLFTMNFIFLLVWTIADPLRFVRHEVSGAPWSTFGVCRSSDDGHGLVAIFMVVLVSAVNITAFLVACFQAYQARNISDEFSESKNLGIALLSWFQILLVGLPVLFLINRDNNKARYFLQVILVFAVCMAMLLPIFVPIIFQTRQARNPAPPERTSTYTMRQVGQTRVSGLDFRVSNSKRTSNELAMLPYLDHNTNTMREDDPQQNDYLKDTSTASTAGMEQSKSLQLAAMQRLPEDVLAVTSLNDGEPPHC